MLTKPNKSIYCPLFVERRLCTRPIAVIIVIRSGICTAHSKEIETMASTAIDLCDACAHLLRRLFSFHNEQINLDSKSILFFVHSILLFSSLLHCIVASVLYLFHSHVIKARCSSPFCSFAQKYDDAAQTIDDSDHHKAISNANCAIRMKFIVIARLFNCLLVANLTLYFCCVI